MCGWRACLWVAWLPGASTPQLGVSTCPHPSHTSRRLRLPGVLSGGWGCCPSLGQRKLLCGLCWRLCSRRTESTSFACIPGAVLCILGHDTKQVQNHRKPCLDCVSGGLTSWLSSDRSGGWSQAHSGALDSPPGAEGLARHGGCTGSDSDVC